MLDPPPATVKEPRIGRWQLEPAMYINKIFYNSTCRNLELMNTCGIELLTQGYILCNFQFCIIHEDKYRYY